MSIRVIPHWISGRAAEIGTAHEVRNPATNEVVATVTMADVGTARKVASAAHEAFLEWSQLSATKRAQVLFRFRDLLKENRDDLAASITEEHGKTIDDARGEVDRALDSLELAIGGPGLIKGEVSEQTGTNIDTMSLLQPLGVCVGITPFNFPVMVSVMMAGISLAAGNAFILKPSEQAPGPALRLGQLLTEAGLPDGVFSVVHGGREVGEALIDAPETQAVAFVGSTPVAHAVYVRAANAGKRVQALGGAKNHLIVMPDADLDHVADQLTSAAFGAAGQRCMAVSVAVVVGGDAEPLLERLQKRAADVTLGPGSMAGAEVGPLVSREAQERVRGILREARAAGARLVVDRSEEVVAGYPEGYFVGPTIVTDVGTDSDVYTKELFAPVLTVMTTENLSGALDMIESSPFGNGASIFTQSGAAAREFQHRVSAGMIGVNVAIPVPVAAYAVQGWKKSAFGDTGLNNQSWSFYTHAKYVTTRWDRTTGTDFGFRPN